MTTTPTTRTITLTDRPPARIADAAWPLVAEGRWSHSCGECGQNGSAFATLRVRRHVDGRALVYVTGRMVCQCDLPEPRGGSLVEAGEDLAAAIRAVAARELAALAEAEGEPRLAEEVAREAIASLPAEEL